MEMIPQGLWPVMLTPFKGNNEVDYEVLKRLTEFYLAAGADGLFANCLSSEMFQLTEAERYWVTKTVVDAVNGKVPVISTGTFSQNVNVNSNFIKKIYDTGVHAVVVSTSQLNDKAADEVAFEAKIDELLNRTKDIPLGLYECPDPYKRLLSPGLLKRLAQTGRFVFHKDTSCDLNHIHQKIKAVDGTSLGFYNANTPTAWLSLEAGAKGITPIAANFYPELFSHLITCWQTGKKGKRLDRLHAFLTIGDPIVHTCYPLSAKMFLKKRGFNININTRIPAGSLEYEDFLKLDALAAAFNGLTEELDIDVLQVKAF